MSTFIFLWLQNQYFYKNEDFYTIETKFDIVSATSLLDS